MGPPLDGKGGVEMCARRFDILCYSAIVGWGCQIQDFECPPKTGEFVFHQLQTVARPRNRYHGSSTY